MKYQSKNLVLMCVAAAVAVILSEAVAHAGEKPPPINVVLILADDLGYGDVGCFNRACPFQTPNLDRMAAEGARLTSFYVPTPYCAPSRATLLTGRYPFRHTLVYNPAPDAGLSGFGLPPSEITLAEALQFEESTRVPLIIAAPGMAKAGTVCQAPVGLIDLHPTLAELCGVKAPENLQGQSLVPMLNDPSTLGRGWAISQVTRGRRKAGQRFFGYTLRTPRWRYTEWDQGKQGRELYDHDADPREWTNLADDPAHAETVAQLSRQLREATAGTFPPSGQTPELRPGLWAPNLTDP